MITDTLYINKQQVAELSYSVSDAELYIEYVWVDDRHRRQGIATQMIMAALAKHAYTTEIVLTCTPPSKRKWQRMGFAFSGDYGRMPVVNFVLKYGRKAQASNAQAANTARATRHRG